MSNDFPYAEKYGVNRGLPAHGRPRDEILKELHDMAVAEDASWESGKVSGTMYCGDHEHYDFMNEAFGLFAHVNAAAATSARARPASRARSSPWRSTSCTPRPSPTASRPASSPPAAPGRSSTPSSPTASTRRTRGVTRPNFIKPETGHPAFDKACHLFGVELRKAPIDPVTTQVDVQWVKDNIDDQTIAILGSACNYPYGTIDDIAALGEVASAAGVGLHVDGCLGGFILPFGQELGYADIPVFDFRIPGVTSISADTHKYGYAFKGTSTACSARRSCATPSTSSPDWSGGKYFSPGIEGSRSGGLRATAWASMVHLGRDGYLKYAKAIFEAADAHEGGGRVAPRAAARWGRRRSASASRPTPSTSTTSAISCGGEAGGSTASSTRTPSTWRPPGPQTQPGVVEAFARRPRRGRRLRQEKEAAGEVAFSSSIYGGSRRRPHRGGRRVHPLGRDRDARHPPAVAPPA